MWSHVFVLSLLAIAMPMIDAQRGLQDAHFDKVTVFVDYNAFGCNATFSSSSSSGDSSGSNNNNNNKPIDDPIVYLQHGPRKGTWHYLAMALTWWNMSLVSAVIPSDHEFVVLCVGSFVHCDHTAQLLVGDNSSGGCVFDNFSNFHLSGERNSVLVVPSADSGSAGDVAGVIIPFCPLFESVWAAGSPQSASYFFTATGFNATTRIAFDAPGLATAMPCGGNGACDVSFTRHTDSAWLTSAECSCVGQWHGSTCTTCSCEPGGVDTSASDSSNYYCMSTSSQGCAQSDASAVEASTTTWTQGVAIVLVATEWFETTSSPNGSYVRANSGNITADAVEWSNWNVTAVDPTDPRWGSFNATPFAIAKNALGAPSWMSAIIPGNLVQFVWYNSVMTDFEHCSNTLQLMTSYSPHVSVSQQHWGEFQCTGDGLNGLNNFASVGGVIQITPSSFSILQAFEPGCQYGLPGEGVNPQQLVACSGHGSCDVSTYFQCECNGSYSGVACERCGCRGGAVCTSTGACDCPPGYLNCSMGGGGGGSQGEDNFCIDVQNDLYHCGQCGNDCTHGFSSAIKQASCVKGVCDVVMQSPLEWEMCFGNMSAGVKRDGDKSAATVAVGCFRGYDFLVVFCCAFPLFVVSLVAFVRIRMTCRQSHMYRQALFLLIALISCLRMSYAVAALIFLGTASTPEDAVRSREFFSATMISLNAYADLFTGFIDLLLTVYWLFVLDRVRTFPKRLLISVCIGMSVVLTVATIVDYASGTSTFDYTFFTLAILLFFTALMHMSVIAEVLIKFVLWSRTHSLIDKSNQSGGDRAAEVEQSFKGSFPAIRPSSGIVIVSPNPNGRGRVVSMGSAGASVTSVPPTTTTYGSNGGSVLTPKHTATPDAPSLQQQDPQHLSGSITSDTIDASLVPKGVTSHFVRVTLIAFVCLLCWMVRSVMLLGRATRQPIFVEGALSFRSSTFTLLYLTLLTLFPCVLIAVIFLALSVDVLRAATVAPGSASSDKTNEDDGASSSHHRAIDSGYRFSPRRMSPRANTTVTPPTLTPSQEERPLLREEN